jgi:chemotaxis-related protein WspD
MSERACWRLEGTSGRADCPRLETVGHCTACPEFTARGRALFDRPAPPGLAAEWTELLAREKAERRPEALALAVFRLRGEWLALPAGLCREAFDPRPVRPVPGRSTPVFRGLVNVRGEIMPCVCLAEALGLAPLPEAPETPETSGAADATRMIAIHEPGGGLFVFLADAVHGLTRIVRQDLAPVPATLSRAPSAVIVGLARIDGLDVGLLDERALFSVLTRSLGA